MAGLFFSCNRLQGVCFAPALTDYPQQAATTLVLKKPLREISGIIYHKEGEIAAVNDEEGKLFIIDLATNNLKPIRFGKKGDYEGLCRTPEGYYVLKSNGDLYLLDSITGKQLAQFKHKFGKHYDFESLCYDARFNRLLLICKACGRDEPYTYAWAFDLEKHSLLPEPVLTIDWRDIRRLGKDDTIEFQPSSAEYHPITGQLFILSSVGKVLAICDADGKPESVHGLNPDLFPQPEGLCFAPNGDLYISNEGRQAKGTLMFFPYQPNGSARLNNAKQTDDSTQQGKK
ncbi:MAG TPA: SdiA-regulated domain-containing protein [Flavihumibacter sp.]|jgi:uncharacterized protein YjiK